jgi:LysM repeat protein
MKTLVPALIAAILIAAQLFTPAAAASTPAALAYEDCGDTYVVQPYDYLALISRTCGTSISTILSLNPQIVNPNVIYSGQVLRLTSSAPVTYWSGPTTTYTTSGTARVSLSTRRADAGDVVTVYVSGFPANAEIDYRVGIYGEVYSEVYDGTVASNGTANQTITLPSSAVHGEYWVVKVATTSLANEVAVTSPTIYIGTTTSSTSYTYTARVSLSATSIAAGGNVVVYVKGFPANAEIDYRVGLRGEDFSLV